VTDTSITKESIIEKTLPDKISPPPVGGDEGEGDPKGLHLVHPHPRPPPSKGEGCPYNHGPISNFRVFNILKMMLTLKTIMFISLNVLGEEER